MKTAIVLVCVVAAITYANAASIRVRRQLVPREFANINIENYLKNERAVAFQLKCIVYDGPCDRIGKYLKITIPELLTNQCRNCDPEQRMRAGRLVAHIQQNFPKEWEDAVKKFQGGQVKPEDAQKLETLLGVKLDPKLVGGEAEASSTAAPAAAAPAVEKVEAPSTAAPTTTTTTTTTAAPTTAAPVATSPAAPAVVPAASEAKSDIVAAEPAAVVVATSEAPAVSSSAAPVVVSSSETPSTSEAPKSSEAPAPAVIAETKA
jgi:hypothetical protein